MKTCVVRPLLLLLVLAQTVCSAAERKLNVLFLAVDDLRPQLGCYGVSDIKSPNIDRLAGQGLLFNRAYCQQAVCSPSRTSLLTGRRPDTTKIYNLQDHFRDFIPDVVTLPQHFKNHGYFCQSFGKIYHGGLDDPKSWSAPSVSSGVAVRTLQEDGTLQTALVDPDDFTEGTGLGSARVLRSLAATSPDSLDLPCAGTASDSSGFIPVAEKKGGKKKKTADGAKGRPAWSSPDVPDNQLGDGKMADAAIAVMNKVKDQPFFLAVGFRKPHLSFDAPKKYYDLYRAAGMRLAPNPFPPKDVFEPAMSGWGELRNYANIPQSGPVSDDLARQLIHGYYAATSYTDAQIGRVITELDRLGLRDKTIIILWGDHGWQLGEHGMWCKHTCFETSTRAMLMISTPGQKHRDAKTDALVEFVDIYPTLCELAGLPLTNGLEGTSFAPLLDDPRRPWKKAAFSQYPRGKLMGYAMRTDRYRYVEWAEKGKAPEGRELYDHQSDPGENVNLANRPESKQRVAELSLQLKAGWRAAAPPAK